MLDEDDVILNALPNSNAFGFVCGALLPLVKAARQVILPSFMPVETSMDAIRKAEVSHRHGCADDDSDDDLGGHARSDARRRR